jgi:tyrosinase
MAVVRRNILTDDAARKNYLQGVRLLKQEHLGPTTADFGLTGPATAVSTYDLFVVWHHYAMDTFTPPTQGDRNAAHRGPVFLPWHRFMLELLEAQLQRILNDPDVGLPYWDWAADGAAPASRQPGSALWAEECMGGQGTPVRSGPFAFDPADPDSWRVRLAADVQGQLRQVNRGLRRAFATSAPSLPTPADQATTLAFTGYDAAPWSTQSDGFRNRVEGWRADPGPPGMHNRVHVWVGGDMLPSSSPNDPVFYLNHCNVDRIWAGWQQSDPQPPYLPDQTAGDDLRGHRIDDQMYSLLADPVTPRQVLHHSDLYTYDALPAG